MDKTMKIELCYQKQYSFGAYHSGFDLFDHIYLENLTDTAHSNLKIIVKTTPNILLKGDCVVDFVAPFGYRFVSCDFLKIDPVLLATISTVLDVGINVGIYDENNALVSDMDFPCRLLPFHYFSGLGEMPETLSFFITPDQRELDEVDVAGPWTDDLDFCQMLYENIRAKKITFASQDYSGATPLPVRLSEKILKERFANTLELALLFASVCEKRGIFPTLAFLGRGKVFVGFQRDAGETMLSYFYDGKKLCEKAYLFDATYLAYGSELPFDAALVNSKNYLQMADEKILVLNIKGARKYHHLPLPDRAFERGNPYLLIDTDQEKKKGFESFYSLMKEYASDARIKSLLMGEKITPSGQRGAQPFCIDLDVNQNKILSKALSNDLTLIRAQTGAGASTIFAHATHLAAVAGKKVLYITDPKFHSDGFLRATTPLFDSSFLLDVREECSRVTKDSFQANFLEENTFLEEKEKLESCLSGFDRYYSDLEGDKRITSSFHFAFDRYHQLRGANESIIFAPDQVGKLQDDMVQTWFSVVNDLVKSISDIGEISKHPLLLIRQKAFSYELKSNLIGQLENLLHSIESIVAIRDQILPLFSSLSGLKSAGLFYSFQELVRLFLEFSTLPDAFFERPENIEEQFKKVTRLIQAKNENATLRQTLEISFQSSVFDLDAVDLYERYQALLGDKGFKAISQKHGIIKTIKRYLKPNCDVENAEFILTKLYTYQKNLEFIQSERESVFKLLSVPMSDDEGAWSDLQIASDLCYQGYSVFQGNFPLYKLSEFVADFRAAKDVPGICDKIVAMRELSEEYLRIKEKFEKSICNQIDAFYPESVARDQDYFSFVYSALSSVLASIDHLKDWCAWLTVRDTALDCGLKNIISVVENGLVGADELKKSFLRAFFKAICEYNFIAHPDLVPGKLDFSSGKEDFSSHKNAFCRERKRSADAILANRRFEALSEVKNGTFQPFELLSEDPETCLGIYPCIISDMKTAKKLFAHRPGLFDYIFIEHRSHLPLSDFVFALSCGKKVAFAGAFTFSGNGCPDHFDPAASSFDYLWKITEEKYNLSALYGKNVSLNGMKSIFGDAIRSDWRSYCVPNAAVSSPMEWIRVSGSFGTEFPGANVKEAEACVELFFNLAEKEPMKRIGIVASTPEQKKVILRLVAQRIREEEGSEHRSFDFDRLSIFSLADEMMLCDIIIYSATFAPDRSIHASRLPFCFSEQGLNDPKKELFFLLSSVKDKLFVITSFGQEEIGFTPSLLPAARAYSAFFKLLLSPAVNTTFSTTGLFGNSFSIRDLAQRLEKCGYLVLEGVQNGRYYLDLAVLDEKGQILMGIISDQTVMNQKANISAIEFSNLDLYELAGWRVYRLRDTDLFDSFESQVDRILSILSPGEMQNELI